MVQMTLEQANRILSEWLTAKPEEVRAQKAAIEYYGRYFPPPELEQCHAGGLQRFPSAKKQQALEWHPSLAADLREYGSALQVPGNSLRRIETS
jgi:hypothetical protein